MRALGPQGRPPVSITINGHTWRSRVAAMRGRKLIGISAAHRAAAGISEGEVVEIDVEGDEAPREVVEPADLADALNRRPQARTSFDRLPFGLRQKHVGTIQDARTAEARERRIGRLIATLEGERPGKG
jgi:uncharacterized protein YdeI (YjbR/CyaY-like superfamily)